MNAVASEAGGVVAISRRRCRRPRPTKTVSPDISTCSIVTFFFIDVGFRPELEFRGYVGGGGTELFFFLENIYA